MPRPFAPIRLVPPLRPGSCLDGLGDLLAQGTASMAGRQRPGRSTATACKPIFTRWWRLFARGRDRTADLRLGGLGGDRRGLEQALLVLGDLHARDHQALNLGRTLEELVDLGVTE